MRNIYLGVEKDWTMSIPKARRPVLLWTRDNPLKFAKQSTENLMMVDPVTRQIIRKSRCLSIPVRYVL